jgi:hypothetical protein
MKKSKKLKRKLETRIREWENMVNKNPGDKKAYRKPGSNHG